MPLMPRDIQDLREKLQLGRREFARLIGYVGSDHNNWYRVKKLETGISPISPMIGRIVVMLKLHFEATGQIPDFSILEMPAVTDHNGNE